MENKIYICGARSAKRMIVIGDNKGRGEKMRGNMPKVLSCFVVLVILMTVLPIFVTQSNAVMPVDIYMGKVTEKNNDVLTVQIEYKPDYSNPHNWVSYSATSQWTISNSNAINEIRVGDYIEIAGYLGVGSEGDSICIGKMKSSTEKVITDVYGDPDYLVPVHAFIEHPGVLNPPLLGNYIITYENTPDCSKCPSGSFACNVEAKYSDVTISKGNEQLKSQRLYPSQNYGYADEEYKVDITFNSGEAPAYPDCTDQPCFGPQAFSDFTIHIKKMGVKKPDLIIQDISWSPSNPKQGDTVTINIITKNKGSGNAGGFDVCYYADGSYYDRDYVSSLSAGSTTTTSFTWSTECGNHAIKAVADCYNAVAESNEENNWMSKGGLNIPCKPDLIIEDIYWQPKNPKQGDTMTFYVYIKNQGSGSAGTSTVKYYIDGSYVTSDSVPAFSAGSAESTQTFTWTANKCGDVQVKAIADATNAVNEGSNEGNNERTKTVSVTCPNHPPTAQINSITPNPAIFDSLNVEESETISFSGHGTDPDGDSIIAYNWRSEGGTQLSTSSSFNISSDMFGWGSYTIYFKVKDSHNAWSNEVSKDFLIICPILTEIEFKGKVLDAGKEPKLAGCLVRITEILEQKGEDIEINEGDEVIAVGLTESERYDTDIKTGDKIKVYGSLYNFPVTFQNLSADFFVDLISSSSFYLNKDVEEKKPDLIIQDISWDKGSPKQGDTITFTITVKNQGSGSAGTSYVYYYIDGSYVDSDSVPALSAGSTSTQTFTWTADKCGNVQVKAVADATNAVDESNEENNQSTETVNVVCPKKQVHNINTGKDFSSIQAAINDSDTSPGHTITVDPGTYTENVDVTKSLTIKSTSGNPADTIVQAAVSNQNYQNVFTVTADNVHVDGFTIEGSSYFWCSGILIGGGHCIISNNTFEDNAIGIWIHPPSLGNNVIRNNKFSSSSGYSPSTTLYLEAANNKIYLNNFIIGMEWGSGNVWNSPTQITYEYEGNTFTSHLGNYWDDYRDTDANGDGIWDHPYSISDEDKDNYPLVEPFENYHIEGTPSNILQVPYESQEDTAWCGPASLSMILKYYGKNVHAWDIADALDIENNKACTLLEEFNYLVERNPELSIHEGDDDPSIDDGEVKAGWDLDSQLDQFKNYLINELKIEKNPVLLAMPVEVDGIVHGHAVVLRGISETDSPDPILYINDPNGRVTKDVLGKDSCINCSVKLSELAQFSKLGYFGTLSVEGKPDPLPISFTRAYWNVMRDESTYARSWYDDGLKWNISGEEYPSDYCIAILPTDTFFVNPTIENPTNSQREFTFRLTTESGKVINEITKQLIPEFDYPISFEKTINELGLKEGEKLLYMELYDSNDKLLDRIGPIGFNIASINVDGRSEGCEDYAPLNVFFRGAKINVKQSPDKAEHTFNLEWWEDSNKNLFIDESDKWIKKGQISITDLLLPEDVPIGLYRLKIRGTDDVSNYFWVIFNATDSGLSEENVQNYWKGNLTGDRVGLVWGLLKTEVKTSHHKEELMICMASALYSRKLTADTEYNVLRNFHEWLYSHLNNKKDSNPKPPNDIMSYVNRIKSGEEPDANCDGFAAFGVSLARAAGIPARVVHGYGIWWSHCWVEPYYSGTWQIWDPAFRMIRERMISQTDSHYLKFANYMKERDKVYGFLSFRDELGKCRKSDYIGETKPQTMIHLECPINATITDQYGRIISDDGTNEIPDASMIITKEMKIFYLPADLTYSVDIDAYDTGTFNFTRISPVGNDISITKFENIPVTSSTKASVEIEPGVTDYTICIDYDGDGDINEEIYPDVSELIEVEEPSVKPKGWLHSGYDLNNTRFYPYPSETSVTNFNILWTSPNKGKILTGDINGDGELELVSAFEERVCAMDKNGLLLWSNNVATDSGISGAKVNSMDLADMDGDNIPDVVVGISSAVPYPGVNKPLRILFYNGAGNLLKTISTPDSHVIDVKCADLNNDGKKEVIATIQAWFTLKPRGIYVYDYNTGNELWHYNIGPQLWIDSIADINNDGYSEIIIGTFAPHNGNSDHGTDDSHSYAFAFDKDGNNLWTKQIGWDSVYSSVADLNNDGNPEIICFRNQNEPYYPGANDVYILNPANGNIVDTYNGPANKGWKGGAIADINGDGKKEIVVGNRDGTLRVLDYNLNLIDSRSLSGTVQAINDVNGDGKQEIIVCTDDKRLAVLDNEVNEIWGYELGAKGNAIVSDLIPGGTNEIIVSSDKLYVFSGIGGEKKSNVRFKGIAYCYCCYGGNDGYGIEVTNILSDPDGKLAIGNSVGAHWAEDTLAQINNISLGDVVEVCGSLKESPDITEGWKVVFLESLTHHLKLIRTGNPSKLDIEIASDKKIYAPNDAVTIMITVTNTGNEPVSLIVDHYSQVSLIDPYSEIIGRGYPSIKGNFITLSKGDHATLTANLRIIEDAREGYYDVKVSLSNNNYVKTAKDLFFVTA